MIQKAFDEWWNSFSHKKGKTVDWRTTAFMAFRAGMAYAQSQQKIEGVSLLDLLEKKSDG